MDSSLQQHTAACLVVKVEGAACYRVVTLLITLSETVEGEGIARCKTTPAQRFSVIVTVDVVALIAPVLDPVSTSR